MHRKTHKTLFSLLKKLRQNKQYKVLCERYKEVFEGLVGLVP